MKTFYAVFVGIILVLIAITQEIRSESTNFYGIADTTEVVLNSEVSVEIRKMRIIPGQSVLKGDTLIELSSQELDMKISSISHELDEIKTRKTTHATMSRAEIRQLKAQQQEHATAIKAEIQQLESEYETNRNLVSQLKSFKKDGADIGNGIKMDNPLTIKISNLKKELALILDSSYISENQLRGQLSYSGEPLTDQINRLEDELKLLMEQKNKLFIAAKINGIIGAVNFKDGEKVSPFTPIATLHTEAPSYIHGFIHENVYSQVAVGQKVTVVSVAENGLKVTGEIIGVGSRIVEYPVRLRKMPDLQMWGREISIKIPDENRFLLGEKVLVSMQVKKKFLSRLGLANPLVSNVCAAENIGNTTMKSASVQDITVDSIIGKILNVEASGAVYLADLNRYLVISDETEKKSPVLFLMDSQGKIDRQVRIDGLDRINDMEAVACDENGLIYISTSQNYSKNNKLSDDRKLFLRIKRSDDRFIVDKKVFLYDLLKDVADANPDKDWADFISGGIKNRSIDIEGIACRHGDLFLGFKNPLIDGGSVIVKISDVNSMLSRNVLKSDNMSLWKTLSFSVNTESVRCRISDMLFINDDLYVLTCIKKEDNKVATSNSGDLWVINPQNDAPQYVNHFADAKPEGVAFNPTDKTFLITCDNGSSLPSQIIKFEASL